MPRSSSIGLMDEPMKVFAHTSVDVKNIPESIVAPIERMVSLLERVEENIIIVYSRNLWPVNFLFVTAGLSMLFYSSSILIHSLRRSKDDK